MKNHKHIPVITIDGPAGVGKGTIVKGIAKKLNWHILDSGALYRLVAYSALLDKIPLNQEKALVTIAQNLDVNFKISNTNNIEIILEGQNVTRAIRTEDCGAAASKVAIFSKVRTALLQRQRDFQQAPGLIADGRDMGTVVFSDAVLKIYLTASAEIRAKRRYKQLSQQGINVSLHALINDVKARDEQDMNRKVSPLKPAIDAVTIDTSDLNIAQVLHSVFEVIENKGLKF